MQEKFEGDMHTHSYYSDGSESPADLVKAGQRIGLMFMVLTDHDNIAGQEEFLAACREYGIEAATGIEVTAFSHEVYCHILGYGFDLEKMRKMEHLLLPARRETESWTNMILTEYFPGRDMDALIAEVKQSLRISTFPSFMHAVEFVHIRQKRNYHEVKAEAFANPKFWEVHNEIMVPGRAAKIIVEAGGIACLAHPEAFLLRRYGQKESDRILNELLDELQEAGLTAIEAYYGENKPCQTEKYLQLAKKRNLLVASGSDYHGKYRPTLGSNGISLEYFKKHFQNHT